MQTIQEFFLRYPAEIRYAMLAGAILLAGLSITPLPSDIVLAGVGVMVGHHIFEYGWTALICTLCLFLAESLLVEFGHRAGPRILDSKLIDRTIGAERIQGLRRRLKRSEIRVMRSVRFTVPIRPYIIIALSALGMDRRKFYKIHAINTLAYVPAMIGGVGVISKSFDLKDWQLLLMIAVLWVLSVLLPFKGATALEDDEPEKKKKNP